LIAGYFLALNPDDSEQPQFSIQKISAASSTWCFGFSRKLIKAIIDSTYK
jgi:hypothetical protein